MVVVAARCCNIETSGGTVLLRGAAMYCWRAATDVEASGEDARRVGCLKAYWLYVMGHHSFSFVSLTEQFLFL